MIDNLSFLRLSGNDLARPFPLPLFAIKDHDLDGDATWCDAGGSSGLFLDCATLLAAKDRLAGTAPLNWSLDVPVNDWQGVALDDSRLRVASLDLTQLGLNGKISTGDRKARWPCLASPESQPVVWGDSCATREIFSTSGNFTWTRIVLVERSLPSWAGCRALSTFG